MAGGAAPEVTEPGDQLVTERSAGEVRRLDAGAPVPAVPGEADHRRTEVEGQLAFLARPGDVPALDRDPLGCRVDAEDGGELGEHRRGRRLGIVQVAGREDRVGVRHEHRCPVATPGPVVGDEGEDRRFVDEDPVELRPAPVEPARSECDHRLPRTPAECGPFVSEVVRQQIERLRVWHGQRDSGGRPAVDERARRDRDDLVRVLDLEPGGKVLDERVQARCRGVPRGSGRRTLQPLGRREMERVGPDASQAAPDPVVGERFERRLVCGEVPGAEIDRAATDQLPRHAPADAGAALEQAAGDTCGRELPGSGYAADARADDDDRRARHVLVRERVGGQRRAVAEEPLAALGLAGLADGARGSAEGVEAA